MQDILTCAMGLDLSPFLSYMLDVKVPFIYSLDQHLPL